MSTKRPRSLSPSLSHSSSSQPPSSPSSKFIKVIPDVLYASRTCTLPPTCSHPHKPTKLSSAPEVEEHYGKYHTHVCEHERCRCVFPDARFLDLHFAECHDPISALKRERGEKIFACYLATCSRLFMTPKGRRLHLIQSHGYPKQFFFAITNKGIGGLLHKWGQGASLYRGDWRSRTQDHEMKRLSDSGDASDSGSEMDIEDDGQRQANGKHRPPRTASSGDANLEDAREHSSSPSHARAPPSFRPHTHGSPDSDTLVNAMTSLSLVPDKIRFGRGGKKGGFAHSYPTRPTRNAKSVPPETAANNINKKTGNQKCSKGRSGRGRTQRRASEGTSSMSGDPDVPAVP